MAENAHKTEGINFKNKVIGAFVLLFVLLIPVFGSLYFFGRYYSRQREAEMEKVYLDIFSQASSYGNSQYQEATESFDDRIRKQIDLSLTFLKDYVVKDTYTGPEVFSDGFVVRLDNGQVILPARIADAGISIKRSEIESGIVSGNVRTASIDLAKLDFAGLNSQENADTRGFLSFGRICEDAVCAQITPYGEYTQYVEMYRQNYLSAMNTAAEISGGFVLMVSEKDGEPVVLEQFGDSLPKNGMQDLGLTMSDLELQDHARKNVNGKRLHCSWVKMNEEWMGQKNVYIVQALPMEGIVYQSLLVSMMICLLMIIFYATIITYSLSEEEYVQKHVLDTEEAKRYNPKRIRRKLTNGAVFSAILVLVIAYLTQSVIQMRQQTENGKRTLQFLSGQRTFDLEELSKGVRETRENWYLQYGTKIASFLEGNPEAQSEEKVKTCSDIIGADFIMLFDTKGNEILCSSDYDGFSISYGFGENSSDFRRLLLGVPGIIHPVSANEITGLERQMIGVTVDLSGEGKKHGALIMSLMPDTAAMQQKAEIYDESFRMIPKGTVCFEAEKESGIILYCTEPSLEGKSVTQAGLPESCLQDGFMDFCRVLGVSRFLISYEKEDKIYFHASDISSFERENLWYGLIAAALYAIELAILLSYLLRDYNESSYLKWAVILSEWEKENLESEDAIAQSKLQEKILARVKSSRMKASERNDHLKQFFIRIFEWDSRIPEKRAGLVFIIGLFILLQVWVMQMLGSHLMNRSSGTLLDYLLNGDWMHGVNLFALYSILVFVAIASLIIIASEWILKLIAGFVGSKGQTICMLLQSLIKYVTIIVVILMSFSYIGMLSPQVFASMGIGSFALSLGAKDVIADVLSGILIVFNETVQVGDIVEYQGVTAKVRKVTIQNTQLTVFPNNDIMTVRNQQITSIINKSRTISSYTMNIKISSHLSVERIESLMEETLPRLKEGCPQMISTPVYLGITALGVWDKLERASTMTIGLSYNCNVKDKTKVTTYMNRELLLLFEKEGIEIF